VELDREYASYIGYCLEQKLIEKGYPSLHQFNTVCKACSFKGNECSPKRDYDINRKICPLVQITKQLPVEVKGEGRTL
jgi:hypothetical protein